MSSQHKWDNVQLNIRIDAELKGRIERCASERKMSVKEYIEWVLWKEAKEIKLTTEDYWKIAYEIEKSAQKKGVTKREDIANYSAAYRKAIEQTGS